MRPICSLNKLCYKFFYIKQILRQAGTWFMHKIEVNQRAYHVLMGTKHPKTSKLQLILHYSLQIKNLPRVAYGFGTC